MNKPLKQKLKSKMSLKLLSKKWIISIFAFFLIQSITQAQTNPAAFDLSTGNFSFTTQTASSSTYPTNMRGWNTGGSTITTAHSTASSADISLTGSANATTIGIGNLGGSGFNFLSSGGSATIGAIAVAINTTGRASVLVSWLAADQTAGSSRQTNLTLQYRVGTSGTFTNVSGSTYTTSNNSQAGSTTFSNIALPSACDNQAVVQLRWLYYESPSQSGSRDAIRLDDISISSSLAGSNSSNIITNTGFTYPTNIDYSAFQAVSGLTTGNSIEVAQFDIQDGGGSSDADALSTQLTALTFTVSNPGSLRRIALFDGSTNVGEVAAGSSATFTSLTLSAADNGSKTFSVRVTFAGSVTDNQQFSFTVNSATANSSGSTFASGNAGAATTSTAGDNNRIEVSTSDIIFDQNTSNVSQFIAMSPSPTVRAIDANLNYDLDNTSNVVITISGGTTTFDGSATTTVAMVGGIATFNNLIFATPANLNTLTATQGSNTDNSNTFNVASAAPEINVKQNVTNLISGSGSHSAGSIVSGNSGSAINFTIENLGSANLTFSSITSSNTTDFTLNTTGTSSPIASLGSTTFAVTFNPTTPGSKSTTITITNNDADEGSYTFTVTGTGTVSSESDIITNGTYSYTSNIGYSSFQTASTLTTGNSIGATGVTLRDGGATSDADNLPTVLTAITFSTGGSTAIRTAALFDGSTNISEVAVNGATSIAFSGLSISTSTDGSTKDFELRITFQSSVTDNQQLALTVSSASASSSNSGFASVNAGAATSSTTGDINRIEVTADRLVWVQQPSNVTINTTMSPSPTISANDANSNRDLDYTTTIDLTPSSSTISSGGSVSAISGLVTFNSLQFSVTGSGLTMSASDGSLSTTANSNSFDVNPAPSSYIYRSLRTGNWNSVNSGSETWERSSNGGTSYITVTSSGDLPSSSNSTILIQNGHTVTISSSVTIDEVTVQNGGILTISAAATINNGTGDDIIIEDGGRVNYTVSTFTFSSSATIRVKTNGIISIESTGLTSASSGVNASTHVYEDGSILQYNLTSTPSASGVTFFPNVTTEIPILRFMQTIGASIGGSSATVINGRVELASGVSISWSGSGAKTFRNGIVGLGGVNVMSGASSSWSISGTSAQLGTNGGTSLTLTNTSGINISSSTTASLVGNLNIGASTNLTTAASGVLVAGNNQLIASGSSVTFTINGTLRTSNANGLNGSTSTTISSSNNPTITLGAASTIEYNSSSAQNITPRAYVNLLISGAGMKSVPAGNNQITFSGTLTTAGLLTLKSDATGTASIGNSAGTISGNITVERFIPRRRAFRFLASPVNTSNFISGSWQQATHITGSLTGQNGFDQSNSGTASLFTYNVSGTEGWAAIPNTNLTNLNIGTGYRMLIRGDRNINLNTTTPQDSAALVLSATGTVVTGNVVFGAGSVSSSPAGIPALNAAPGSGANESIVGWSLIGNPYACAVNWANVTKSNVSTTFATWNVNNAGRGSYVYHNGSSGTGTGASNIINSGQSIFVQTTAANPSITFTEASKVSSTPPSHFKKSISDVLNIDIFIGDRAYDGLTVLFDTNNSNEYDVQDFIKLVNPEINFYSYLADGTKLAMNNMKEIGTETIVPLGLNGVFNGGSYELKFSNQNTFTNAEVFLKDKFINKTYDLKSINNLFFTVTADSNSFGENRFELVFSKSATGLSTELTSSNNFIVFPNPANNVLNLSLTTTKEDNYSYSIFNQLGAEVSNGQLDFNSKRTHALNIENLNSGVYFIQVKNGKSTQTIKFIK